LRAQWGERFPPPIFFPPQDGFNAFSVVRNGIRRGCNSHIPVQGNSSRSAAKPPSPDVPNNKTCPLRGRLLKAKIKCRKAPASARPAATACAGTMSTLGPLISRARADVKLAAQGAPLPAQIVRDRK